VLILLAVTILGACASTKTIEVRAVPDGPGKVKIDDQYHKTVAVEAGDRLAWKCDCPSGTEFMVAEVRFATDLDKLVDMLLPHAIKHPEELDALIESLKPAPQSATSGTEEAQVATLAERDARVEKAIGEARAILEAFRAATAPAKARSENRPAGLFVRPLPNDFVDARRAIRSARVVRPIGAELWVFTWKVRVQGRPDTEVPSDPHIYTHPEDQWP
jgi:hypothetical protein